VIQCAAAIKKRPAPTSLAHDSVGTEGELAARVDARKSLESLHLTRAHLEPLVHSAADLEKAGYFINVPDSPGGTQPSLEGEKAKCERCAQPFVVKRKSEADECIFHWGRPYTTTINGIILVF
jgi:RNA exonuclease 1